MRRIAAVLLLGLGVAMSPARAASVPEACQAGRWFDPATGARLDHADVLDEAAARGVVLLGETHDNAEHHRWQLSTVAGLLAQGRPLVLGFEAFPRRVQPVLDRWSAGELDTRTFLREVGWNEVWGFDPALYLPLFELARLHRIPIRALNVERAFVSKVGEKGWAGIPPGERHGIGDPAAPADAYLDRLAESHALHAEVSPETAGRPEENGDIRERPAFRRFVDAQLTWDRAMAEALAAARMQGQPDDPLVVGIIGSEHLRFGHGVPHQLADLGVPGAAVLLPDEAENCADVAAGVADAVFLLDTPPVPEETADRPRLGVLLGADPDGVKLEKVLDGSVAQAAGLLAGDVVLAAAGREVRRQSELVDTVRRQAPGTWLPLRLRRGQETIELVAKFPAAAAAAP